MAAREQPQLTVFKLGIDPGGYTFSSVDVSPQLICLGTTSGALFLYDRARGDVIKVIVPPSQNHEGDPVILAKLSPRQQFLAYASQSGVVTILKIDLTKPQEKDKMVIKVAEHKKSGGTNVRVTCLEWDPTEDRLFSADSSGYIIRTKVRTTIQARLLPESLSESILHCSSGIVQLDYNSNTQELLISHFGRVVLMHAPPDIGDIVNMRQMGISRDGQFGACFERAPNGGYTGNVLMAMPGSCISRVDVTSGQPIDDYALRWNNSVVGNSNPVSLSDDRSAEDHPHAKRVHALGTLSYLGPVLISTTPSGVTIIDTQTHDVLCRRIDVDIAPDHAIKFPIKVASLHPCALYVMYSAPTPKLLFMQFDPLVYVNKLLDDLDSRDQSVTQLSFVIDTASGYKLSERGTLQRLSQLAKQYEVGGNKLGHGHTNVLREMLGLTPLPARKIVASSASVTLSSSVTSASPTDDGDDGGDDDNDSENSVDLSASGVAAVAATAASAAAAMIGEVFTSPSATSLEQQHGHDLDAIGEGDDGASSVPTAMPSQVAQTTMDDGAGIDAVATDVIATKVRKIKKHKKTKATKVADIMEAPPASATPPVYPKQTATPSSGPAMSRYVDPSSIAAHRSDDGITSSQQRQQQQGMSPVEPMRPVAMMSPPIAEPRDTTQQSTPTMTPTMTDTSNPFFTPTTTPSTNTGADGDGNGVDDGGSGDGVSSGNPLKKSPALRKALNHLRKIANSPDVLPSKASLASLAAIPKAAGRRKFEQLKKQTLAEFDRGLAKGSAMSGMGEGAATGHQSDAVGGTVTHPVTQGQTPRDGDGDNGDKDDVDTPTAEQGVSLVLDPAEIELKEAVSAGLSPDLAAATTAVGNNATASGKGDSLLRSWLEALVNEANARASAQSLVTTTDVDIARRWGERCSGLAKRCLATQPGVWGSVPGRWSDQVAMRIAPCLVWVIGGDCVFVEALRRQWTETLHHLLHDWQAQHPHNKPRSRRPSHAADSVGANEAATQDGGKDEAASTGGGDGDDGAPMWDPTCPLASVVRFAKASAGDDSDKLKRLPALLLSAYPVLPAWGARQIICDAPIAGATALAPSPLLSVDETANSSPCPPMERRSLYLEYIRGLVAHHDDASSATSPINAAVVSTSPINAAVVSEWLACLLRQNDCPSSESVFSTPVFHRRPRYGSHKVTWPDNEELRCITATSGCKYSRDIATLLRLCKHWGYWQGAVSLLLAQAAGASVGTGGAGDSSAASEALDVCLACDDMTSATKVLRSHARSSALWSKAFKHVAQSIASDTVESNEGELDSDKDTGDLGDGKCEITLPSLMSVLFSCAGPIVGAEILQFNRQHITGLSSTLFTKLLAAGRADAKQQAVIQEMVADVRDALLAPPHTEKSLPMLDASTKAGAVPYEMLPTPWGIVGLSADFKCGVCHLSLSEQCAFMDDTGGDENDATTGRGKGTSTTATVHAAALGFRCGHVFHKDCVPEQACLTCLCDNMTTVSPVVR